MQEDGTSYFAPSAIVLVGFLIAVAIFSQSDIVIITPPAAPDGTEADKTASMLDAVGQTGVAVSVSEDDDAVLGNPSAPVSIIEFSDFQCPFCGVFARDIKPRLEETYIIPGKVKFVYRDYPILGAESRSAAQAAECAGAQGKFWEYHDVLYQNQRAENKGIFSNQNLTAFVADLSLDMTAFQSCVANNIYEEEVSKDFADAQATGVPGTPAFVIQGKLYTGISTFEGFQAIIDKELGTAR